jgi:hypothetical protein
MKEVEMPGETLQNIMDYLKANPDVARRARDYAKAHPDDVKMALKDIAEKRGWDLTKIDTTALKTELSKIAA